MPELPEVEFAKRKLGRWAIGRRIERARVDPKGRYVFRPARPAQVERALAGERFEKVERVGKNLLITLAGSGRKGVLSHLGMTGKWARRAASEPAPRFSRLRLELDDGSALHYCDSRLFGRFRLVPGARFEELPEVRALGPDPLDEGIDPRRLAAQLARRRVAVKPTLMDQRILAGVGNIQASEALWRAKIDPRRRADRVTLAEARRIAKGVLDTIRATLRAQGDGDEITYVEEPGGGNPFSVYGRKGEPCRRCRKGRIERVVQAGRSTYFCPACQSR